MDHVTTCTPVASSTVESDSETAVEDNISSEARNGVIGVDTTSIAS